MTDHLDTYMLQVTQLHSNASACKYRTFTGVPATPAMAQWGAQALKLPPEQLQLSDPGDGAWRGKVAWWFRAPAQPIGRWRLIAVSEQPSVLAR